MKKAGYEVQTVSVFVVLSLLTLFFVFGLRLVLFEPAIDSSGVIMSSLRPSLKSRAPSQECKEANHRLGLGEDFLGCRPKKQRSALQCQ